jgi:spermidine synthase
VQQSESPLVHLDLIKSMRAAMHAAGFNARRTLPFPQPCYPTGWWSCTMARKAAGADFAFREADANARVFPTRYYSAEVHKGAQALPPFVAEALAG